MEGVGAWHTDSVLRRRPMRLRTKVTLFFGLIALVATVTLTIVTYAFARESLLDQRAEVARQQAILNAIQVRDQLRSESSAFCEWFPNVGPEAGGYAYVRLADGQSCTTNVSFSDEAVSSELRGALGTGASAAQRFDFRGESYVGVGVHIAEADANYYEAFQLGSTAAHAAVGPPRPADRLGGHRAVRHGLGVVDQPPAAAATRQDHRRRRRDRRWWARHPRGGGGGP